MTLMLINALIAGFLGTVLMTISQYIEIFITKRQVSNSPAMAFSKVFKIDFNKLSGKAKTILTYAVHFGYGTIWALAVYVLYLMGIQNMVVLTIIYFSIIVVQGWIIIPLTGVGPMFWKLGVNSILIDSFQKFILTFSTVFIFLALIG